MSRRQIQLTIVATLCAALGLAWTLTLSRTRPSGDGAPPGALAVLWDAPPFALPDQDGQEVTLAGLRGHVWIADFIFTRCTSACPILSARMVSLQRRIADPSLRFISFSVDPEHDTPPVLKEYAALWNAGERRWRLLANTPESLREIAAGMKVPVQATGDEKDPILHTNRFVLVDQRGRVRGLYDSTDEEELRSLMTGVAALTRGGVARVPAGSSTAATAGAAEGARLLAQLGCLGCHATPRIAPALAGVFGQRVELAGGHSTVADEAYLRESILKPAAKVVAGYPPTMPAYSWLEPAQVDALVAHLATLGGGPAPAARTLELDPVCDMTVSAAADVPHAEWRGKTYWFCSEECRVDFVKAPEKFVRGAAGESDRWPTAVGASDRGPR